MNVRTRIAPSPTGDPHVGTAYVALINLLFAKKAGGAFILRIEDTDRARSSPAAEAAILDALGWLGLSWDEGPDIGGPYGPYRQSERTAIYRDYSDRLLAGSHAFKCFCTPERLAELRAEQRRRNERSRYDGLCLERSPSESAALEAEGRPYVVRMKVPAHGTCAFEDLRRGRIEIGWSEVDMQVLLKSDGMPTYHLANVVDDHLMRITHVLRGEEWLPSAPKHVLLYGYFGWEMPKLFHLPLLRNADRSKLSKRKNPTSVLFYRAMGYLPEALLNFLGLFGVSSAEGEEMATLEQLIERFDIANISLGGPIFDTTKLAWLNGRHIRETLSVDAFADRVRRWSLNPSYLGAIAPLVQTRIERLSDLGPLTAFFFSGLLNVPEERLRDGKLDDKRLRKAFHLALLEFDMLPAWQEATIEGVLRGLAEPVDAKFRDIVRHFYTAITGSPASVPLFNAMAILGRDLCRERLKQALDRIGGVSRAEAEEWRGALAERDSHAGETTEPAL